MKKALLLFLPLALASTACIVPQPQQSPLEIRAIQTRTYDVKDVKLVMKAVMHALQDDDFMIKQADADLGLLTARKEVDLHRSRFIPIFTIGERRREVSYEKNSVTEVSANISEFGNQTTVRVNFQRKILDNNGRTMAVHQLSDPYFFQIFFSKVDKSVFLGKENVQ